MVLHHHTLQVDMDQDMFHQLHHNMDIILDIHQLHHHTMEDMVIKNYKFLYFISSLDNGNIH